MAYQRKTRDEYNILGNYGYGFELVDCAQTWNSAREAIKTYRQNEPGIQFKILKKRVKLAA